MNLPGMLAHDARACGKFISGFPAHGKAHQEGANFLWRSFARQQFVEGAFQRFRVQRLAPGNGQKGGGETVLGHGGNSGFASRLHRGLEPA